MVDLANAFCSIAIAAESQDQFAFAWEGHQWMFQDLPEGYLYSPTTCHGLVAGDLEKWPQPKSVQLFHYIDNVLLTSDSFADLEQCAPELMQHLESCGWAVKATKIQGPILSVKFLQNIWSDKIKVIPETVVDKIQMFPWPTTVTQLQIYGGLFGYGRMFIPHLA